MKKPKIWFIIEMARGDLEEQAMTISAGERLDLDEIYFTVKKRYDDTAFCFQKRLSTGGIKPLNPEYNEYLLRIEPEDTNKMQFGKEYVCDIEIYKDGEIVKTFNGKLLLGEEVTTARDEL